MTYLYKACFDVLLRDDPELVDKIKGFLEHGKTPEMIADAAQWIAGYPVASPGLIAGAAKHLLKLKRFGYEE
jgi:hypothetical protein